MPEKKTKKTASKAKSRRKTGKTTRSRSKKTVKRAIAKPSLGKRLLKITWQLALIFTVLMAGLLWYLNSRITTEFKGLKFASPAQVYGRPLELYPGLNLSSAELKKELNRLGYRSVLQPRRPGEYLLTGQTMDLVIRGFDHWNGHTEDGFYRIDFSSNSIDQVRNKTGQPQVLVKLDPLLIGNVFPQHQQDRILVTLDEAPRTLKAGLLAVEDRDFYHHFGISLTGIARALVANVKAGGIAQGGSTLTQQLVKNLYLDKTRSLSRKAREALMAILLEFHYSKDDILQAYMNEVYLAQDGARAVHGFGLASIEFFGAPLRELRLHQQALLVGMIKGPNLYNPFRNPERALKRRNLVLDIWAQQGLVKAEAVDWSKRQPLDVRTGVRRLRYPHFLDLVRRQLKQQYRSQDLNTQGLRIHTSLDPRVQEHAEATVMTQLNQLEKNHQLPSNSLQTAMLVSQPETGEILAMIGDRKVRYAGYNRALDANRPVGSLLKPAVYLAALEQGHTLASLVDDSSVVVEGQDGSRWEPENFDQTSHGQVLLVQALAKSYNQATARLGMETGLEPVINAIKRLGIERDIPVYPSVMLGALELSPLEMLKFYGTFAANGFQTQPKAITAVTTADNELLQAFDFSFKQRVNPEYMHLMQYALEYNMAKGTGRYATSTLGNNLSLAGKTGTTNDYRDSWFAGYSGDYLSVVWIGRDDNGSTHLTGSSGALRVWTELMRRIRPQQFYSRPPPDITQQWISSVDGGLSREDCGASLKLPFIKGTEPEISNECGPKKRPIRNWFKKVFGKDEQG